MMKYPLRWLILSALFLTYEVVAQRQMEKLGRGMVAVRSGAASVYVGWRLLGNDPEEIGFNLYRSANGGAAVKLNGAPLSASCNFSDTTANLAQANGYFVRPVIGGAEGAASATFTLSANAPTQQYFSVPIQMPPGGTNPPSADGEDAGGAFSYTANDCSVGDLDGDGEYEIVLKWEPTNAKDNSQSGHTGPVYLDAYRLNGTRLWRINLGRNIRAGAHYTQFMVYDLDGDGRAELACKTAPGTMDGQGNLVFLGSDDPSLVYTNDNGYILSGPEYLTIFDGLSGAELATTPYLPGRGSVSSWGDNYGNRVDRFLACIAYLDGVRPSLVMCRGYYTRAVLVAWDWRDGQLTQRWVFDNNNSGNGAYFGQGNHNLSVADVDADGKDEIIYGACTIDDNGTGLYSTGFGHGDALHVSDHVPDRPGLEVWTIHEPSGVPGADLHDARTGQVILATAIVPSGSEGPGRGAAGHVWAGHRGAGFWGGGGFLDHAGNNLGRTPGSANFLCWWDADLARELLDGNHTDKYGTSGDARLLTASGASSNNGSKATPGLSVDIVGDWREEVIFRASDNQSLRIYTTTTLATNRLCTLMHDPQYRLAIAWQNVAYNQPPHPGFYLGTGMFPPPVLPVSDADLVWRGGNGNFWDATAANWFTNGLWVSNNTPVAFTTGASVLFDLSGSNNAPILLNGTIAPAGINVHSAKDFAFAGVGSLKGDMKLVKAGPGRLTINNTNAYTGETRVSGGELFVNGSLDSSPVIVERRGTPEGPSQFGGNGRIGGGLTVQNGCVLIVGPGTNSTGTMTASNQLTELGNVLNRFDLSNDPTGTTNANDRVNVIGHVTLAGTNIIAINQLNGFLGNGVYPLITYSGTLTGGLTNLALVGEFIQSVALTNPPGMIALLAVLPAGPPTAPSNLTATAIGAFQINLNWTETASDENALLVERSQGNTANFAQVALLPPNSSAFQDIGLAANTTYYYRVRGTNLVGFSAYSNTNSATTTATPPSLTWRGDGVQNIWDLASTANWRNGGAQTVYADGSFITFDQSGSNSPAINLAGSFSPGTLTVNATKNYGFGGGGSIGGAVAIGKSGSGSLTLSTTNTFTGGINLTNGSVVGGSANANNVGFGRGPITLYGGILEFAGWTGSTTPDYGGNTNAYIIPAGQTATIRVPQRFLSPGLNGPLTGGGTLNLQVKYVRGNVSGNWTGFTGRINVAAGSGGATVDDFRVVNATGLPNARLNLGTNVLMYSRTTANSVIPLGEFSGVPGAIVSAGFGTSEGVQNAVTWRVGGLNTDATNAALFQGTTSLIKEGTGRWTLTRDNTYTGTTTINGGTLILNGNQSAASGNVFVNANGTLGGNGVIGGNVTVNGALSPGTSIGRLTFHQNLTLNAAAQCQFEISRNPRTNDVVAVSGDLVFGGTLNVANTSVELFRAGDNFQLFTATSFDGDFIALNLPTLEEGLAWNTSRLTQDGRIWVVKTNPPMLNAFSSGADFFIAGNHGTPNWTYYVLTATNLAPLAQWIRMATNQFDGAGGFSFTNTLNAAEPQRFYQLEIP